MPPMAKKPTKWEVKKKAKMDQKVQTNPRSISPTTFTKVYKGEMTMLSIA
jgi:hypothetical protein